MRGSVVFLGLLAATFVDAEPARWQQATNAPSLTRVWGINGSVYGTSAKGVYRSTDGGATWTLVDHGAAVSVWGAAKDDLWIVRAKTIHRSATGTIWSDETLPMLSYAAQLEGMWGVDRERYLFGADRTGVILHSRDAGTTWRAESLPVEVARIAGVWGSATNDIYAVGARGVILHSEGDGQWNVVRPPTTGSLEGIWGTGANNIYAVGTGGAILHSANGKTWTPRTSGVSYTLSSITGLGSELYVSSADGAPLRSTDGKTWKPLTAIIPRGHAWPIDGERVVVAGGNDVHFLETIEPPNSVLDNRLSTIAAKSASYGPLFPAARDLLAIAVHRLGDASPLRPDLREVGKPVTGRIKAITNCSPALDALGNTKASTGLEAVVEMKCEQTCAATRSPKVRMSYRALRDGVQLFAIDSNWESVADVWCSGNHAMLQNVFQGGAHHWFFQELDRRLAGQLARATSDDARLESYARYLLDGGKSETARFEVARIVGRPYVWKGFFWNDLHKVSIAPRLPACDLVATHQAETTGDTHWVNRRFDAALASYQQAMPCKPELRVNAFAAACEAKRFIKAFHLFQQLTDAERDLAVEACVRLGYDPRNGPPPL